jgi:hypothetical protein
MARRVFFSFHYDDVSDFRVNVVRNSGALKQRGNTAQFIDKSLWEEAQRKSPKALKQIIDNGLNGCGVTALLIGTETADRRWVKYELVKSFTEGKGILAIYLNRIKSRTTQKISPKGMNPLSRLKVKVDENCEKLSFFELNNRRWEPFLDLPQVNNRQKNSFEFAGGSFLRRSQCGNEYLFSELFSDEYCWQNDDGYSNFPDWVEHAAEQVGR